jgi:hypothetical protein
VDSAAPALDLILGMKRQLLCRDAPLLHTVIVETCFDAAQVLTRRRRIG